MILDSLQNITRYKGIHPNLDTAIAYLERTDLRSLPLGRTDIDGDKVFVSLSKPQLGDNKTWEKHRLYADIQIALEDGENIAWADEKDLQCFSVYDAEKGDIQLSEDPTPGVVCAIKKDHFGLYFPHDAHRPGIGTQVGYKAVVKVRV